MAKIIVADDEMLIRRLVCDFLIKAVSYTHLDVYKRQGFAGYKDWFIQYYDRPGYTIEVGLGQSPLPLTPVSYTHLMPGLPTKKEKNSGPF